jgi:predicted signal transduction protein with EAL and GGDEF domain
LAEKVTEALLAPIQIGSSELQVSASIGIALVPHDGDSAEQILKSADMALYKAKEEERGKFCFFDKSLDEAAHCRQQIEREMRLALERDEFELYYQPKVAAADGSVSGAEALIRWNHPERGLVGFIEFIPIAEANRFIVPIGEWVLRTASAQLVAWQRAGLKIKNCSINMSPVQVASAKLLETFNKVVAETGVDPAFLEIEITESALMNRIASIVRVLRELRRRGVAISVDDFGTGYSSLVHMKQLPLDKLKIDRSFVMNIENDSEDAAFTKAIVALGQSMD